jgi:hypothetical protein
MVAAVLRFMFPSLLLLQAEVAEHRTAVTLRQQELQVVDEQGLTPHIQAAAVVSPRMTAHLLAGLTGRQADLAAQPVATMCQTLWQALSAVGSMHCCS